MIENTVKSVRRKETVDDAYIENLYADMTALYRLDQIGGSGNLSAAQKADLGKLPVMSVVLLSGLGTVWLLILLYVVFRRIALRHSDEK